MIQTAPSSVSFDLLFGTYFQGIQCDCVKNKWLSDLYNESADSLVQSGLVPVTKWIFGSDLWMVHMKGVTGVKWRYFVASPLFNFTTVVILKLINQTSQILKIPRFPSATCSSALNVAVQLRWIAANSAMNWNQLTANINIFIRQLEKKTKLHDDNSGEFTNAEKPASEEQLLVEGSQIES